MWEEFSFVSFVSLEWLGTPKYLKQNRTRETDAEAKMGSILSKRCGEENDLREWLVNYLANALDVKPESISHSAHFDNLGLDSVLTLTLAGDLELHLRRSISETIVFDYPSIESLARHLASDKT